MSGVAIQSPRVVTNAFLVEQGVELMRWWNEQGPKLPEPGQRFARWWRPVFDELDENWAGPGLVRGPEIWARLVSYSGEAQRWYATGRSDTAPPPAFAEPPPLLNELVDVEAAQEGVKNAASVLWAVAGLGVLYLLIRRR